MKHTPEFEVKFRKLNTAIRITSFLLLIILFFGATFIQSSIIYANDQRKTSQPQILLPFFEKPIIERELYPKSVIIKDYKSSSSHLVFSKYAKDILKEIGWGLGKDDEILPSPDQNIPNKGIIVIVKVDIIEYTKLKTIPFKIKEIETEDKERGYNEILTEGVSGVQSQTFREVYKDGNVFKKEIIKTETLVPMVTQVVLVGTKPVAVHSCKYWNKVIEDFAPKDKFPEKNAWMRFVMYCETGCDSGQVTNNKYYGLYQFSKSTYKAYGGANIFDGYEQVEIVSKMYDLEGNAAHHWPACNSAFEREYNK